MLCICPSQCISSDRSNGFEKELDHSTKLLQIKESDTQPKSKVSDRFIHKCLLNTRFN